MCKYAERFYGDIPVVGKGSPASEENDRDIEADINNEIAGLQRPDAKALFQPVKIDVKCGMSHLREPANQFVV